MPALVTVVAAVVLADGCRIRMEIGTIHGDDTLGNSEIYVSPSVDLWVQ